MLPPPSWWDDGCKNPYRHSRRSSFWTWLLMEVPELQCQLWLWVSLPFRTICPLLSIVFWAIMFISAMQILGITVTLERGIAKLYPYLTSLLMSFQRRSSLAEAPLWFPKVRASRTSFFAPPCLSQLTATCCHPWVCISSIAREEVGQRLNRACLLVWTPSQAQAVSPCLPLKLCWGWTHICSESLSCAKLLCLKAWSRTLAIWCVAGFVDDVFDCCNQGEGPVKWRLWRVIAEVSLGCWQKLR